MKRGIFNSIYKLLLKYEKIEVNVSQELEVWNDIFDENSNIVNDFFAKFIHTYGIFHDLLGKSDAHGDRHELELSLIDENILMEGTTRSEASLYYDEDEDDIEKLDSISFEWLFDKISKYVVLVKVK